MPDARELLGECKNAPPRLGVKHSDQLASFPLIRLGCFGVKLQLVAPVHRQGVGKSL
ncbi:hypothetical protein [Microvirga sp. VF16]|uniref:hypothetical protein n=1 Tax=Microvirga sp. VF16 TaxID=2807101 RepID=UPI00193E81CE|nr:hypothetical protein [Microvirga sp. VF16]QRM32677.1 hypothetical protein JO965_31880 [Microvirga sp. VF16]